MADFSRDGRGKVANNCRHDNKNRGRSKNGADGLIISANERILHAELEVATVLDVVGSKQNRIVDGGAHKDSLNDNERDKVNTGAGK